MKDFDVIILGDGIAAYGVARELLIRGRTVLMASRSCLRGSASLHAAGILDPLLEMEPSSPLLKLHCDAFRSFTRWTAQVEKRTGKGSGYRRTGLMYVAKSAAEERVLYQRFQWQRKLGIPIRWQSPKSTGQRQALVFPTAGRVEPQLLMKALAHEFLQLGGVKRVSQTSPRLLRRQGHAHGLKCGTRLYSAGAVVDATGCWAHTTGSKTGEGGISPVRGQIVLLRGWKGPEHIVHALDGTYLVPWKTGVWLAGSTVENAGFRAGVTSSGIRSILRRVSRLAPEVMSMRVIRSWAGLRPRSRDGLPLIGEDFLPGLFHANGYYRSGILIGVHAGRLLARGLISGKLPEILAPFDPKRLSLKKRRK